MRKHHISFIHAWEGIATGFRTQPNFRVHLFFSSLALALSWLLDIGSTEFAIILFVIATGLAIELINTSVEYVVDLLTDEYRLLAKFAKDTAAGAMLVYAIFSVCVALVIFAPRLWLFI